MMTTQTQDELSSLFFAAVSNGEQFYSRVEHMDSDPAFLVDDLMSQLDVEHIAKEHGMTYSVAFAIIQDELKTDPDYNASVKTNLEAVKASWPEAFDIDLSLVDKVTGKIVPPKSVADARMRSDWPMWERAIA